MICTLAKSEAAHPWENAASSVEAITDFPVFLQKFAR